jgi:6-phosphogluconolactonase
MKRFLLLFLFVVNFATNSFTQKNYLFVGTYTSTGSDGIYIYDFDPVAGKSNFIATTKLKDPSFLTTIQNKFLYAVSEKDTGTVTAYQFENEKLNFINSKTTFGRNPCYITSRNYKNTTSIIVGNYSSGNLTLYATDNSGGLTAHLQTIQHIGSSINPTRQKEAHVHQTVVSKNNATLYVPDLGMDKVMNYTFSGDTLVPQKKKSFTKSIAGSGPRHITINNTNTFAYLMEELTGTVVVYKIKKNGVLKKKQIISSHVDGFKGVIGSADIHLSPNGKFLYASNRGDANNLAIFRVHKKNGKLTNIAHQAVGKKPRNFNFSPDGKFLLVANQDDNSILVFKADPATGLLTDTGNTITVPNPVCLVWMEK